jgi:hypothetical protein
MSKKVFLTFANTGFMKPDRIINEAKEFGVFDEVRAMNEHDISDFISKHSEFIKLNPYGYGRFIWKPKVIFDTLNTLSDNDILVYSDAGMSLNKNGLERFNEYIDLLETNDMITFSTNDKYKANFYVKVDAVMSYCPEMNDSNMNSCYAGLMLIKKTDASLHLIEDWLKLCETYNFIDNSKSTLYEEKPWFVGQDTDNGLFNLCLLKHKISHSIYPDEVNIYVGDSQYSHVYPGEVGDWTSLSKTPFHYTRNTPKLRKNVQPHKPTFIYSFLNKK